ncbi:MAG: dihydroorotate dehydrogenase electron transfer subunit [Candidatus Omnitrophota bacterium]|nr:dihydroorotate dehydrogenase electron transfer subunit [Candidatus Omnitrophota bacterium]
MKQLDARILSNRCISGKYYLLRLSASGIARLSQPGQFIHLRCSESLSPLLRRPFSIHRVSGAKIDIFYQVVGKGTEILSKKKAGQYLDVIGPLGRGFEIDRPGDFVLVAGGMGIAPLLMLAQRLSRCRVNKVILVGAKTKSLILCKEEFKRLGFKIKAATEDGSLGFKGLVTDLLEQTLRIKHSSAALRTGSAQCNTNLYVCGPQEMLKKTARISSKYRLKAQGSLERNMACGVGACLGCVIKTTHGYRKVCQDGPVFNLDEIIW